MKNLFLLRHAKSSWDNAALGDFDRPLSKRGISNAILLLPHRGTALFARIRKFA